MLLQQCINLLQITLPTGAQVVATLYQKKLLGVAMNPSTFDVDSTRGLYGIFNYKQGDDLTPRVAGQNFLASWR